MVKYNKLTVNILSRLIDYSYIITKIQNVKYLIMKFEDFINIV